MTLSAKKWVLLVAATALAALLVIASPASKAFADGGSNQSCSLRGPSEVNALVYVCNVTVSPDVDVSIELNRVLNDNELTIIRDVTVKDIDICKATGKDNNACSVVILDDVTATVLTFVNVNVSKITVRVGNITVSKNLIF